MYTHREKNLLKDRIASYNIETDRYIEWNTMMPTHYIITNLPNSKYTTKKPNTIPFRTLKVLEYIVKFIITISIFLLIGLSLYTFIIPTILYIFYDINIIDSSENWIQDLWDN